jgi:hypothetical protein
MPGMEFDKSCDVRYGKMTAKEYINRSIQFMPGLATAGKEGLEIVTQALRSKSGGEGAAEPSVPLDQVKRIVATYRVLFGDIKVKDPNFAADAQDHIAKIRDTMSSLDRMIKTKKPNLIIHCNDDWLDANPKAPKDKKPTQAPDKGHVWVYDTDRNEWEQLKGGKPCQGQNAAMTYINKSAAEKRKER